MASLAVTAVLTHAAGDTSRVMPVPCRAGFQGVYCSELLLSRTQPSPRGFPAASVCGCGASPGGGRRGCPEGAGERRSPAWSGDEGEAERCRFSEAGRPVKTGVSPRTGFGSVWLRCGGGSDTCEV